MNYKVINEELKIASCRIEDLTMEQVTTFLKIWNDDSPIGSLTVFYDQNSEYIVLNEDNENFSLYLDIAEEYLKADKKRLKEIREKAPNSMRETLITIESFRHKRLVDTWISRACKNGMSNADRAMVRNVPCGSIYTAFKLGVIRGKRIERAKRKK